MPTGLYRIEDASADLLKEIIASRIRDNKWYTSLHPEDRRARHQFFIDENNRVVEAYSAELARRQVQ